MSLDGSGLFNRPALFLHPQIVKLHVVPFRSQTEHAVRMGCIFNRGKRLAIECSADPGSAEVQVEAVPLIAIEGG